MATPLRPAISRDRHDTSLRRHNFYIHLIPEFEPSPTDPLHLALLMKDIRRTLRA
jgi:hypothetical protein